MKIRGFSRRGIEAIFEMLRNILHAGQLDKRVQYMIEVIFQIRKDGFKDHEAVPEELDLVEEENQITHLIKLDDEINAQDILNVFKFDTILPPKRNINNCVKKFLARTSMTRKATMRMEKRRARTRKVAWNKPRKRKE
ncbi:pre-mRNA-splicing factor CWC22 homolog [Solenopsis invicta]|uniref:pre-mRNA-splicing factor CWC22 homolog n=1 Tax=Solenopsis invicta TaxID=13686 RepID=UPI000E34040B|nr:pre-mRNA-splicing factor CWC22 homolog [Solenopsis invicta]